MNDNEKKTQIFWNNTYKYFNYFNYKCISSYTNDTFIYQSDNDNDNDNDFQIVSDEKVEEKKDSINTTQKQNEKQTDVELAKNVNIIDSLHKESITTKTTNEGISEVDGRLVVQSVNCNCMIATIKNVVVCAVYLWVQFLF